MESSMLDTPEERIKSAGDRLSKVIQAFYWEFGNITRQDACGVIGVGSAQLYRDAQKAGLILTKGCRPQPMEGSIAYKKIHGEAIAS